MNTIFCRRARSKEAQKSNEAKEDNSQQTTTEGDYCTIPADFSSAYDITERYTNEIGYTTVTVASNNEENIIPQYVTSPDPKKNLHTYNQMNHAEEEYNRLNLRQVQNRQPFEEDYSHLGEDHNKHYSHLNTLDNKHKDVIHEYNHIGPFGDLTVNSEAPSVTQIDVSYSKPTLNTDSSEYDKRTQNNRKGSYEEPVLNRKGSYEEPAINRKGSYEEQAINRKGSYEEQAITRKGSFEEQAINRKGSYEEPVLDREGSCEQPAINRKGSYEEQAIYRKGSFEEQAIDRKGSYEQPVINRKGSFR